MMKKLSVLFGVLAVILSDVMCAVVAFEFCKMIWGIRYAGYSAPAWIAFLWAIPFAAAIAICAVLSIVFKKKSAKETNRA